MRETEDHLYPEVYQRFAPIAEQLIREMEKQHGGSIFLNENLLQQMIDEAIRRADLPTAQAAVPTGVFPAGSEEAVVPAGSEAPAEFEEAVPVLYELGRNRGGHNRRHGGSHWHRYDRGALSDIFRILFLQQIFGRRRPHWRYR